MTTSVNVTLSAYDGDDFDDADTLFRNFVLSRLGALYPGTRIEVSTALGGTRVFIGGETDPALASEIAQDWWTDFVEDTQS